MANSTTSWEDVTKNTINNASKSINGGEQGDITFGTNWYLNSATKIMSNYVWTDIDKKDTGHGNLHIFEVRFQIDFKI